MLLYDKGGFFPLWSVNIFSYTIIFCFLSRISSKIIDSSELRDDMIWYSKVFYLMLGWLGGFVFYIYALFLFMILKYILPWLPNTSLSEQYNLSK